ncbi:MAG: YsnF/AvaK domain-containing protein [Massilia sp.]
MTSIDFASKSNLSKVNGAHGVDGLRYSQLPIYLHLQEHTRMAAESIPPAGTGSVVIPVHQEELRVDTRQVDAGRGVRIHKHVTERPQQVDEILHADVIDVRHVVVDKIVALDDAPASRQEGDTLIIPVLEEVLVVERRLRIKEEIHITTTEREERHSETVLLKSEEVEIERFDDASDRHGK